MEAPLALYRRYRPETFSEVIGQDHVTAPLRNALSNNRVNHAYLFSGPRGCGKTTSARILARAINCEKGPIAEPCGVCKSCTDLARGGPGSIDVIEIDAASHGGVDDARDLRERAFFAPVESRYKIYIIDEAHMVTTQGFNALLKLVEEPPPHLKFIFATTEPDKVIGTIRSRTHHYPFRLVPPKALGDYMASLCESEGVAIEPAALPLVVRAGAGSVRDSLSVLDQLIGGAGPDGVTYELAVALLGFTPDSLLDACVDGFAAHDSKAVFETIEKVIETGQDPKRFAEDLLRRLRDLVVLSAVPNAIHSGLIEAAEDQGERLQTQAAGIGAAELTRAADIVAAGLLEMRGATAPRLQLELICAKVLLPGADDSTNGIQARLDRLERRLTIPAGTPEAVQPPAAVGGPEPDAATSRAAARAAAGGSPTGTAAAGGSPTGTAAAGGSAAGTAPAGAVGGPSVSGPVSGPAVGGSAGTSPSSGDSAGPGGPANAGRAGRSAGDGVGSGSPSGGAHPGSSRSGAWGDESASATPAPSSQPASSQPAGSAPAASAAPGSGSAALAAPGSASAVPGSASGRSATPGSAPASSAGPETASGTSAAAASSGGGPGSTATGASGAPSAGAVGLADIRRLWPEVLEAVKAKRRFAWIMLSQNAQVIAVDDQTLTLGLVNAGARESFARSGSDEILRQAMIDTIGLNRRIEAVVDPSTDPGAGGGGGQRPPTSPSTPASGTPAPGNAPAPGGTPGPGGASAPDDAAGPGGAGPGGAAGPGGGGAGGGAGTGVGTGATGGPSSTGATASGGAVGVVGNPAGAGPGTPGGAGGSAGATGAANSQSDATDAAGGPAGTATRGSGGADSPGADAADGPGGYATDATGRGGPHASGSAAGHAGHAGSGGIGGSGAGGATGAESTAGGPGIGGPSADASAAGGVGVGDSAAGGPAAGGVTGGGSGGSGAGSSPGGASAGGGPGAVGAMAGGSGGAGAGGPGASGHVVGRGGVAVEEPPDYDVPPEPDPWDDPPPPPSRRPSDAVGSQVGGNRREQAASKRRAAEAAVAAEQARRAAQGSAAPEVALTPEEEADAIGEDDLVLEDDSQSHTELLRQTLGAQIITEEPN